MRSKTVPCIDARGLKVIKLSRRMQGFIAWPWEWGWHGHVMTPANLIKFGKACVQIGNELEAEKK